MWINLLPQAHICIAEKLLQATNSEKMYVCWSYIPDIDMYSYHRYKYHRISQFESLFKLYGDKQQDKKSICIVLLSHLYIDCISGPIKCMDGLNFTCNPLFFDGLSGDCIEGIKKVYSIIHDNNSEFHNKICNIFQGFEYGSKETYIAVMLARLIEMTIGRLNIEKEVNCLHSFLGSSVYKNVTDVEYRIIYNNFTQLELQVNQAIMDL